MEQKSDICFFLMRHAQSRFNMGINNELNSALSKTGIEQAIKVTGSYDLVICSNLLRTKETLDHSQIKYHTLVLSPLCREVQNGSLCDYLPGEDPTYRETPKEIEERIRLFKVELQRYSMAYPKILILTHAIFICYLTGRRSVISNCEIIPYQLK